MRCSRCLLGNARNERSSLWLPRRTTIGVNARAPIVSQQMPCEGDCIIRCLIAPYRSCYRRFPHGSALGTKSSDLRTCQVLLGYLVLPGTIRLASHGGIHPHLAQRRGDASLLPSPVAAVADGCTVPVTRSALALGAAHARLSAVPQRPRYSSRPGGWNLRCRRGTAIWATPTSILTQGGPVSPYHFSGYS